MKKVIYKETYVGMFFIFVNQIPSFMIFVLLEKRVIIYVQLVGCLTDFRGSFL